MVAMDATPHALNPEIKVVPDAKSVAEEAARRIVVAQRDAIARAWGRPARGRRTRNG